MPRWSVSWLQDEVKTSWTVWRHSCKEVKQRRDSGSSVLVSRTFFNSSARVANSVDKHYAEFFSGAQDNKNVLFSILRYHLIPVWGGKIQSLQSFHLQQILDDTEPPKCAAMKCNSQSPPVVAAEAEAHLHSHHQETTEGQSQRPDRGGFSVQLCTTPHSHLDVNCLQCLAEKQPQRKKEIIVTQRLDFH